jgi:hypothetical protein
MSVPVVYRSTDANAPVLFGGGGSLITLLDACLVNGYGSVFATGTLTSDGTNPSDGDTVTVGSITYTFRNTLAAANDVKIGASAAATVTSLAKAIDGNGVIGTDYNTGTLPSPEAWTAQTASPLTITARKGGTAGNSIALARAGTTPHFTVSGATLTGGSGTDSKVALGWTKPFTGANWQQADYKQPAGSAFYLQIDDSGPGAGAQREARSFGFETMTAYNTGTGQFPTTGQVASGAVVRKSSSLDGVARAWTLVGDDRTFHLFTYSNDSASQAHGLSFGDFYSFLSGDAYKCMIMAGSSESASTVTTTAYGTHIQIVGGSSMTGHYVPRNYAGTGGSTNFVKAGDGVLTSNITSAAALAGNLGFPNYADGGLYLAPLRIFDGSTPATSLSGTIDLRGRIRGLYHAPHAVGSFADGDTFAGAGDYAGRTFFIAKIVGNSMLAVETTAWDTST